MYKLKDRWRCVAGKICKWFKGVLVKNDDATFIDNTGIWDKQIGKKVLYLKNE